MINLFLQHLKENTSKKNSLTYTSHLSITNLAYVFYLSAYYFQFVFSLREIFGNIFPLHTHTNINFHLLWDWVLFTSKYFFFFIIEVEIDLNNIKPYIAKKMKSQETCVYVTVMSQIWKIFVVKNMQQMHGRQKPGKSMQRQCD